MDLNFVDPPMPVGAEAYGPRITAETVAAELEGIARWIETDELPVTAFQDEAIAAFAAALREPAAAERYASSLPMVARFLTIELDPGLEGENGIGRVSREPPPRFGGRYRKQLADPESRNRLGRVIETLIFYGYASMVANSGTRIDPFSYVDRPLAARWGPFMRSMVPTYGELTRGLDAEKRPSETTILILAGQALAEYSDVMSELRLGRGLRPFSKSRAKSYGLFFVAVGNSLWAANTDLVWSADDPDLITRVLPSQCQSARGVARRGMAPRVASIPTAAWEQSWSDGSCERRSQLLMP